MTTDRPYQKGMVLEDALNRIKSFVGSRYDGKVVEALVQACNDGQIRAVGVHPNTLAQNSKTAEKINSHIPQSKIGESSNFKPTNTSAV